VDNVKLDLGKIAWGDMDWIGLAQDTVSFEHVNEPSVPIKC
jgi:hypothetical protein